MHRYRIRIYGHPDVQAFWAVKRLAPHLRIPDTTAVLIAETEPVELADDVVDGIRDPERFARLRREMRDVHGFVLSSIELEQV